MDSVSIAEWDNGQVRAICSGFGHVMDGCGNVVLRLGEEKVPHGQEVRVARFSACDPSPQMVIRYEGHNTDVMVVDTKGNCLNDFRLNHLPTTRVWRSFTGMERTRLRFCTMVGCCGGLLRGFLSHCRIFQLPNPLDAWLGITVFRQMCAETNGKRWFCTIRGIPPSIFIPRTLWTKVCIAGTNPLHDNTMLD